jgi:hypothetical protein
VVRTWLYTAPNRSPLERILNYTSFFVSAVARGIWLGRPDVVIGSSPQLFVGLAAWFLARRFRCPFVFEVRDLWPESLAASGISREGSMLYRALETLARFLYRSADLIVPVTPAFCRSVVAHAPRARMVVIENGVDTALFGPCEASSAKRRLRLEGRFVVSYIGTIGFAHGLDIVLRAAETLRVHLPDLLFLLIGEGAERARLQAAAEAEGLTNVRFLGQKSRREIPEFIAASDACVVLLRRSALFETVLPSKMLEFMACARPVVLGVSGYARSLVEESGGGLYVPPEDHDSLVDALRRLHDEPDLGTKLGEAGYRFVCDRFRREAKAKAYVAALEEVIGG